MIKNQITIGFLFVYIEICALLKAQLGTKGTCMSNKTIMGLCVRFFTNDGTMQRCKAIKPRVNVI